MRGYVRKKKLVHRGANLDRTKAPDRQGALEKTASDHWNSLLNSRDGRSYLYSIIRKLPPRNPFVIFSELKPGEVMPPLPTQEEATAVASAFQWMFTNVGRAELEAVYRKAGWEITIKSPPLPERRKIKTSPPLVASMPAEDD